MSGALAGPQATVHTTDQHGKRGHVTYSGPEVDYRLEEERGLLRVLKWVKDGRTGDSLYLPGTFVAVERSRPVPPPENEPVADEADA